MTLLVALHGTDGLVLAADSRGTFGDPRGITAQNDSMKKAHVLSTHVGVLQAGAGEVGALLIQELTASLGGVDGVTAVLGKLRNHVRNRYNEWFPSVAAVPPPALAQAGQVATRPDLVFLVAGYEVNQDGKASEGKIFQIASLTDFAPTLHDYGFAVAGVAQYALYLLNRLFEVGRSVEDLVPLAVYAITETASQDGKVGGPVNVVTISEETGCQILTDDQVAGIIEANSARSTALRGSFYGGDGPT
ncbi:MAG: hypothetical protein ACYDAQ_02085 [Mycobacteriales bacterium]